MSEPIPQSDIVVTIEPLWVPSVALDPSTYGDVYALGGDSSFPVRVAVSDSESPGHATRAWSTLLAEGYVADRGSRPLDVVRNLPVRAAVFAAQFSGRLLSSEGQTEAGLIGVTLSAAGHASVVSTGGYSVIRLDKKGEHSHWVAAGTSDLAVLDDDPAARFDSWEFEWLPGDTIVVCGRGLSTFDDADILRLSTESLAAFQGRMRMTFARESRPRSATAIRIRLTPNGA